eukprot:TRINITY_DN1354_c1_g1_i1.p1 TRINITY_DN1354_c1_g1~~TRINITY_DN1354_c1_g1_i1.p1  ORF type:complete len:273 (-),score=49.10 TRINITY_DN1354_c1_g1_i1:83-901(-)
MSFKSGLTRISPLITRSLTRAEKKFNIKSRIIPKDSELPIDLHDKLNIAPFKYNDLWNKHRQIIPFKNSNSIATPFITGLTFKTENNTFVAPCATISGAVELWTNSSIWYGVTIHADVNLVRIGAWSNIQDGTMITEAEKPLSFEHDGSTIIGHYVTVGHGCILRACTIEDECLVGMGSILEEGSYMEKQSILGAGSVLRAGQRVPHGEVWVGSPARFLRKITHEEEENFIKQAEAYYRISEKHKEEFFLPGTEYQEAEKLGYEIGFQKLYH